MPAYPWQQRPDDLPLTADEVCEALFHSWGNVTEASLRLKVGSLVLRRFVERSPRARAVIAEMNWRRADKAVQKLDKILDDDTDGRRQDWAIRQVLNSANARSLGHSTTDDAAAHALDAPRTQVIVQPILWGNGARVGPPAPTRPTEPLTIDLVSPSVGE